MRVNIRWDLSLSDLCNLQSMGYSVMRTPHVGSLYPSQLALASMGFHLNLYDRTVGSKDENYHPHGVVARGMFHPVAASNRLLTHLKVGREVGVEALNPLFPLGASVAQCHISALREAFPSVRTELYTEYLKRNRDLVLALLQAASSLNISPDFYWRRKVGTDGSVYDSPCEGWETVEREGIYGITNETEGWVIPNFYNVLIDGVVEAVNSGKAEVYHLSGPDMVNYIGRMEILLDRVFDHCAKHLPRLPEQVTFNLVPVADMRLVCNDKYAHVLDELVETHFDLKLHEQEAGGMIRDSKGSSEVRRVVGRRRHELRAKLVRLAEAGPDVLYDISRATFFSQYDILLGERLYVHPYGCTISMMEAASLNKVLRSFRLR